MNGCYAPEVLALFIADDLSPAEAASVNNHVRGCEKCLKTCDELETSQTLVKSRLRPMPNPELLSAVRHNVLSKIQSQELTLGWRLKLERMLWACFRKQAYAYATLAILVVISASLLAQIHHTDQVQHLTAAVFDADGLVRPGAYRDWVFLGSTKDAESLHNVYIEPAAYRQYAKTGIFPEGTVFVRERVRPGGDSLTVEASVKDSNRFPGGWAFFAFTDRQGKILTKALPDGNCRSCHEQKAEKDQVFTQFYPVLRLARMES